MHSPGAFVTYDSKTKTLFTSDIFGALSDDWSLFASHNYLTSMELFHSQYMPSNQVLKRCMEKTGKFDIERILPQHGSILEGDQVKNAIEHLKTVSCGIDLDRE